MSVSIIWSYTAGGAGISTIVDHGNAANGASTDGKEIFIRHTGENKITNVGLYIRQISGTYSGSFTALSDINEILSWGDAGSSAAFGGFMVNFQPDSYPSAAWPTLSSKSPTGGFVHRTGYGDNETNAVTIPTSAGPVVAGEILSGVINVRFKTKIKVPTDETLVGIRQFESILRYTYTS
jgi:hypothetical protein